MSANEKAEAILIVVKRLLKWAGFAVLALVVVVGAAIGYERYQEYQRDRPRVLTSYAGVTLGDSAEQVRYALGNPGAFLEATLPGDPKGPWSEFPRVFTAGDSESETLLKQSIEWRYTGNDKTLTTVEFAKPGGPVTSIACYSPTVYSCPGVFGLRDGTPEEEVVNHLGKPTAEALEGVRKVMRYEPYNLTLYLQQRRVYMLEVTGPARSN